MIVFDAQVMGATGNGRLRLRLSNGHHLTARAPADSDPARLQGVSGAAELSTHPTAGWRFVAAA